MNKKPAIIILLISLFLLILYTGCSDLKITDVNKASEGLMQLTVRDVSSNIVTLEGEWEFYWNKHLYPEDFVNNPDLEPDLYFYAPGTWVGKEIDGEKLGSYGIATFRLFIDIPFQEKIYGFLFSRVSPAYRVFVDGKQVFILGNPSEDLEEVREGIFTGTVYVEASNQIELIIQVSNRSEKVTGLARRLFFGDSGAIANFDALQTALDAFLLGIVLIIALYHLIYWITQRRKMSVIFFAGFCFVISLRISIEDTQLLMRVFTAISWETTMKINFLTYFLTVPFFYSYFRYIYPQFFSKILAKIFWIICAVLCIPILVLRIRYYDFMSYIGHFVTGSAIIMIIFGTVRACIKQGKDVWIQLGILLVFFFTAVNDILYADNLIVSTYIARYGLVLFILTQAYLIGKDFGGAYIQMRKLLHERKSIQAELEKKVKQRTKQLEQSNNAKTAFLRNMSHEMRTPINGIVGFAELLSEVTELKELPYYASLILDESDHLLNLVNQLLDLSRIEAGKLEIVPAPFSLIDVIHSIEPAIRVQTESKGLKFAVSVDSLLPNYVIGDRVRYRQILFNLLGNSLKFTDKGDITMTVKKEKEDKDHITVYTEVRDTGIGIPEDKQAGIFNIFEQADSSHKRRFGGTGLGTAIARQLARMMGGDIDFHSIEGKGSVFWFRVVFGKYNGKSIDVHRTAPDEDYADTGERGNILLVEDYPTNQKILKRHLEKAGYSVWIAENGKKAVDIFNSTDFDLVIMDIQMPVMDGYESTAKIRETAAGKKIPIIGLTASAFTEDRDRGLKAGMDEVLTKPVRKTKLLDLVHKYKSRKPEDG